MKSARVGIVGTGFIARGLVLLLDKFEDLRPSRVLTRREPSHIAGFPRADLLTRSVAELIDASDIVVECSGDVLHATDVVDAVLRAGIPVVTMDAEFHVTTGSHFTAAANALLTEAEGDQPGCLAALNERLVAMGFKPLVYGNVKGFLDPDPTPEAMHQWSNRLGISLRAVTAFTDGTKLQIEQALVANGLGAGIASEGLLGPEADEPRHATDRLAAAARAAGTPIADYVLSPKSPPGVFIVAEHDEAQAEYLRYLKLGDGPYFTLVRGFHLIHLEIPRTLRRVLDGGGGLLDNSALPRISVAAIAKHALARGARIERGIGSFDVRGCAVRIRERAGHVPIGLLDDAVVRRSIEKDQALTFDDVELRDSLALRAWRATESRVLHGP